MLTKNHARWVLLAALVALVSAFWLYPTDERRVRDAAEALAAAANRGPSELEQALDRYAVADVSITAAELPEAMVGREALVRALRQASQLGEKLHFHFDALEVAIEGKRARLNADLVTSAQAEVPELRRPRHSVALFEKREGRFLLLSAEIGAERRDQPEARP